MSYAVIRTGGKQYKVAEGETIRVDLLPGKAGEKVNFDDVLVIGGAEPKIGKGKIAGAIAHYPGPGGLSKQLADRAKRIDIGDWVRARRFTNRLLIQEDHIA